MIDSNMMVFDGREAASFLTNSAAPPLRLLLRCFKANNIPYGYSMIYEKFLQRRLYFLGMNECEAHMQILRCNMSIQVVDILLGT